MKPLRPSRRAILAAPLAVVALGDGKAGAAEGDFNGFLAEVRREAVSRGIRAATVDVVFRYVQYLPKVVELDRHQPEHKLTFSEFITKFVTAQRKEEGRQALADNWPLLQRVAQRFRVQPRFIVALWGIETAYGKITGNYFVPAALATLAYDGRRGALFRAELVDALRILDQGHVRIDGMLGSWAGAMGQCQFMPSTFLRYAVDFDGDGRRDIWSDRADVFGSIANYVGQLGWRGDEGWGKTVSVPPNFDTRHAGLDVRRPVSEWGRLGVRPLTAGPLAAHETLASVVLPDGAGGPALLVYDNFRTIMRWNRSTFFAAAVGYLADSLDRS